MGTEAVHDVLLPHKPAQAAAAELVNSSLNQVSHTTLGFLNSLLAAILQAFQRAVLPLLPGPRCTTEKHHALLLGSLPWILRYIVFWSALVLAGAYTKRAAARQAPGWRRLLACVPAHVVLSCAPLLFDPHVEFGSFVIAAAVVFWVDNFKLLAFALNRGALARPGLSWKQFTALLVLPVVAKHDHPDFKTHGKLQQVSNWVRLKRYFLKNAGMMAAGGSALYWLMDYKLGRQLGAVVMLVGLGDIGADFLSVMLTPLRLEFGPQWLMPTQSRTLKEFWGRRWNLLHASALRTLIYDPIIEGRLIAAPGSNPTAYQKATPRRRMVGMLIAEVCSGAMHEFPGLLFGSLYGLLPPEQAGKMLLFFTFQGLLLIAEQLLSAKTPLGDARVPKLVRSAVTLALVQAPAMVTFWPFMEGFIRVVQRSV